MSDPQELIVDAAERKRARQRQRAAAVSRLVRRATGVAFVAAVLVAIVVVENQRPAIPEGASLGRSATAAFPQMPVGSRISTSWFCPGIAAGDGVSTGNIVISNPTDSDITAAVTILGADDAEESTVVVPARDRQTIEILKGRTVGVYVPIVELIGAQGAVEQTLTFAAGDVTSACSTATSPTWYFADGFTLEGSTERLVLTNPFPQSAVANVSIITMNGERRPPNLQGLIIGSRSLKSFALADQGANGEQTIAMEVTVSSGKVVASRMQHYLGGGRLGYSTTLGTPLPLDKWWFAGGVTGPNIIEKLVVFNPNDDDITVTAVFVSKDLSTSTNDGTVIAPVGTTSIIVPARQVVSLNTENAADLPKGEHGIVLSTENGATYVAEHAISRRTRSGTFTALGLGTPDALTSRTWWIPSGLRPLTKDVMSIMNTSNDNATVTVSAIGPGGEYVVDGMDKVELSGASMMTLRLPATSTDVQLIVRSTQPVVVQRQLDRGHALPGYAPVLALPQRGS